MFVVCKLPQGLRINHNGRTIDLRGANVGFDPDSPLALNKLGADFNGYGLTELSDKADADVFKAWVGEMTKDGEGKPLREPYAPIANGSIQWADSKDAAVKLTEKDAAKTGFEPIDPETDKAMKEAGVETNTDAMKGKK